MSSESLVVEPLEHSVLLTTLNGGPMEGAPVLEPIEHSVLEKPLDGGPLEGMFDLEPLEHSVPVLAPMESADTFVRTAIWDPLEHAGPTGTDDVGQKLLPLEPFEHSVPEELPATGGQIDF